MANCSGTDQSEIQQERARRKLDQQQAKLALQQKIKAERQKREHVKQQQNKDHKKEEDERKQREVEEQRTDTMTATASVTQVVFPDVPMDSEMQDTVTNLSLLSLMNGDPTNAMDSNNADDCSPVKNRPRKLGTTDPKPKLPTKHTVKGAL